MTAFDVLNRPPIALGVHDAAQTSWTASATASTSCQAPPASTSCQYTAGERLRCAMAHVVDVRPQALVGGVQPASSRSVLRQQRRTAIQCQAAQRPVEVSICTNKTCKKQGSKQVRQSCNTLAIIVRHDDSKHMA